MTSLKSLFLRWSKSRLVQKSENHQFLKWRFSVFSVCCYQTIQRRKPRWEKSKFSSRQLPSWETLTAMWDSEWMLLWSQIGWLWWANVLQIHKRFKNGTQDVATYAFCSALPVELSILLTRTSFPFAEVTGVSISTAYHILSSARYFCSSSKSSFITPFCV